MCTGLSPLEPAVVSCCAGALEDTVYINALQTHNLYAVHFGQDTNAAAQSAHS